MAINIHPLIPDLFCSVTTQPLKVLVQIPVFLYELKPFLNNFFGEGCVSHFSLGRLRSRNSLGGRCRSRNTSSLKRSSLRPRIRNPICSDERSGHQRDLLQGTLLLHA